MNIAFTGHRDKLTDQEALDALTERFPAAVWFHGGAIGFDTQVSNYAQEHGIVSIAIKPNYDRYGRLAPLVRDREIVDQCERLVACYDERHHGGTYYTVNYARKNKLSIIYLPCLKKES